MTRSWTPHPSGHRPLTDAELQVYHDRLVATVAAVEALRASAAPEGRTPAAAAGGGTWISLAEAAFRFGMKPDTLRNWCRNINKFPGLGQMRCGRWQVNIKRLREIRE